MSDEPDSNKPRPLAGTLADLGATLASEAPPQLDPGLAATGISSLPPAPRLPNVDALGQTGGSSLPPGTQPAGPGFASIPAARRYTLLAELGRGQQGVVYRAEDLVLRREVALKALILDEGALDAEAIDRFVAEAQLTAQIAHPHVIPIHDAGRLPDGRPFYTMPLLPDRTLEDLLAAERGEGQTLHEDALVRLMRVFTGACMAMHAAHERGVIHRDLKPANIMLGPSDEALVADFGLARIVGEGVRTSRALGMTVAGNALGTPLYMSPEQARGQLDRIDRRTDVYALGAILYELLTQVPPLLEESLPAQLVAIMEKTAPSPIERAPTRMVPPELSELSMRCLEKAPEDRPPTALALVQEVDAWLAGSRRLARQREEAARHVDRAEELREESQRRRMQAEETQRDYDRLRQQTPEHAPLEVKEPIWRLEEQLASEALEIDRIEDECAAQLEAALRAEPGRQDAREALVDLLLMRMAKRRQQGDGLAAEQLARHAIRVGGQEVRARLSAPGWLTLKVTPEGAEVSLRRYTEELARLRLGPARPVGPGEIELPAGSYRLTLRSDGREAHLPFTLRQGERRALHFDASGLDTLPEHFVLVPAGPSLLGGDLDAPAAYPPREEEVHAFALAVEPVTCAEYLEFVRSLPDAHEALGRCPRATRDAESYWILDEAGAVALPEEDAQGDHWEMDWPIFGVSALDAEAYLAWRSERDGRSYRLPTDAEWERAARGADGRAYPWGNRFDPAFCHMRMSRPGDIVPDSVGSFETDVSAFGVRDLAGCVAEWTSSSYRPGLMDRSVRGGGWSTRAHRCVSTFRGTVGPEDVSGDLGFRALLELG